MSTMNKNILLIVVLALFFVTLVSAQEYAEGRIVIGFNEGIDEGEATNLVLSKNLSFLENRYSLNLRFLVVFVPEGRELDLISEFEKENIVKYAELDYIAHTASSETSEPEEIVEDEPLLVEDIDDEVITEPAEETDIIDEPKEDVVQDSTKNKAIYYVVGIVILIGLILFWILRKKK